jgi:GDPmannose 4,6-dehydratase
MRWKGDREVECRAYDIKAAGTAADDSTFHKLRLGNLEAKRDWGHAKDYVEAMRMMLNQNEPKDYVIATGETHSVKEFLQAAFSIIELNYEDYTISDSDLYRPSEVDYLLGDSSLARKELGWIPQISFEHLVREMVESDIKANSV